MNLLYTITAYPPSVGGAQIHFHELAKRMAERHTITVRAFWKNNRTDWLLGTTLKAPCEGETYNLEGVEVNPINLSPTDRRRSYPWVITYYLSKHKAIDHLSKTLLKKLESYDKIPDLVHNNRVGREPLSFASFKLARKLDIPFCFTPNHHPRWEGWNYREYCALYRAADGIFALTPNEKNTLIELGVEPDKIFVTGIGPILAPSADPQSIRQKYDLGDSPLVLFLGQKFSYKGYETLLKAAPLVWKHYPEVIFFFAGPRTKASSNVFRTLGDSRVVETDIVSLQEKTDLFAACDVFCMPSMQESFGGVYLEAWTFKKPVIGGNIPAIRDVIKDGVDGFIVDQNPEVVADRLIYCFGHPAECKSMGLQGYRKVVECYTWNKIALRTENAYQRLTRNTL
jgi:glycosyltransferase involved in cell wall biosynthesis